MKIIGFTLVLCCCFGVLMAQNQLSRPKLGKNDTIKTYLTEVDGQLIPWIVTPDIKITDTRIFKSEDDRQAYNRLKYNVYKVMPYAKFAGNRYRQLQRDLATTADKAKQKEMMATCEKEIKDLFNKQIKDLTITQGEILIKLVNRETGYTSYDMAKEIKGPFHAFMFQSIARIFGHNLKQTYDVEQDRDIENILQNAGYYSSTN